MSNNRFSRFGDDNFNKGDFNPAHLIATIAQFLKNDSIPDISFGSIQNDTPFFSPCNSLALPTANNTIVKIDNFTEQVKIAIDDCFNGIVVRMGADSICCILPDKTVFKIQITKL